MDGHGRKGLGRNMNWWQVILFTVMFSGTIAAMVGAMISGSWAAEWLFGLPHRPLW